MNANDSIIKQESGTIVPLSCLLKNAELEYKDPRPKEISS